MTKKDYLDEQDCRKYIDDFLKDLNKDNNKIDCFNQNSIHYEKKLDILKDYFFGNLYLNKTYGYGYGEDADRAELVKVILFLYYRKVLNEKNFKKLNIDLKIKREEWKTKDNNKGYYHTIYFNDFSLSNGDTLNTFATLFSRACEASFDARIFEKTTGIIRKKIAGKEILSEQELFKFYKKFQTIGNFMLLPDPKEEKNRLSLNTYRAGWKDSSGWYDYFDLFLKALETWYCKNKPYDEIFDKLMKEEHNKAYFNAFGEGKIGFKNFLKFNCIDSQEFKKIRLENKIFYHWIEEDMDNISAENYNNFAEKYVEKATQIITERANNIIDAIEK